MLRVVGKALQQLAGEVRALAAEAPLFPDGALGQGALPVEGMPLCGDAPPASRALPEPAVLAAQPSTPPTIVNNTYLPESSTDSNDKIFAVLDRLDSRLNEPFVTVNTVTGDHGIQQAQDEYNRLMRNKSPKSRK